MYERDMEDSEVQLSLLCVSACIRVHFLLVTFFISTATLIVGNTTD
jgi:hypothetical protein